jgi:hypothetical protein
MESKDQQLKQLEQQLVEKAMKDEQFRSQLVNNPRETIEKEMGVKIPESIIIKVLEEDINNLYLILPTVPVQESDGELTEADLQLVAGGTLGGVSTFDAACSPEMNTNDNRLC